MNIKAIAASVVIAAGSVLGGAVAAEAQTCFQLGHGSLCNTYSHSNRHGQVYSVGYVNGREEVGMTVVCDNRNLVWWEGTKRNMTEGQVRWVATEFCALPN